MVICWIADTLLPSGLIPSQVHLCPKKLTSWYLNCTLFVKFYAPLPGSDHEVYHVCSYSVPLYTNVSSAMSVTPLRPSSAESYVTYLVNNKAKTESDETYLAIFPEWSVKRSQVGAGFI